MTAWFNRTVLESLAEEADRRYPLETGGIMAGYFADSGDAVVLHVIGPGPNAAHSRRRFVPDHEWQCARLDELFKQSNGKLVYLGDWHTHPDSTGNLSWLDHRTLSAIAKHPAARLISPLMLIGGGRVSSWQWRCHQYDGKRLLGLIGKARECRIRLF